MFGKKDLKVGDWCLCRNGKWFQVQVHFGIMEYKGTLFMVSDDGFNDLWSYEENLKMYSLNAFDIMKVVRPNHLGHYPLAFKEYGEVVFERTKLQPKQVTMAEIEEKFGCPIEIVERGENK